MEEYARAKVHIKNCLKPDGRLLVEEKAFQQFRSLLGSHPCQLYGYHPDSFYFTDLHYLYKEGEKWLKLPEPLQNRPSHDLENFMAVCALCVECGVGSDAILRGFATFQKPHHRIEKVATLREIHFFDDSKGTNIDAVIRAVESMEGRTRLIAGGVDKGASYFPWIQAFQNKVCAIYVMGQAAKKIQSELSASFSVTVCQNLKEAVQRAYQDADPGDHILLSPGCSSFDMFDNYVHRGKEFQRVVGELRSGR
jgi:UDP-N-acetylmuramoylalanine--D-glutamate ligase